MPVGTAGRAQREARRAGNRRRRLLLAGPDGMPPVPADLGRSFLGVAARSPPDRLGPRRLHRFNSASAAVKVICRLRDVALGACVRPRSRASS